jgi:hypothetical protein
MNKVPCTLVIYLLQSALLLLFSSGAAAAPLSFLCSWEDHTSALQIDLDSKRVTWDGQDDWKVRIEEGAVRWSGIGRYQSTYDCSLDRGSLMLACRVVSRFANRSPPPVNAVMDLTYRCEMHERKF